ncbi:tyrosine-type recombinase/integrase, partial [Enterobacter asburiae]|uniref:tyrosine-type recombinase/integrase n=1 Tax=Enterobacter asburiae TaxID=61645 RepID=UPI0013D67EF7
LWTMSRTTAWRITKRAMQMAGVSGRAATPRGLRHGFGVGTVRAGISITLIKRWMGHSRLSSTEVYLDVIGLEERRFAE